MRLVTAITVLLFAPALVQGNPIVTDEFCFDGGSGDSCIWPEPGQTFTVTLYLDRAYYARDGIDGICFCLERTFGGTLIAVQNLFEQYGGLSIGNPDVFPGYCMTSGVTCRGACGYWGELPFAAVTYLYTGPPGIMTPIAHGTSGAVFADCNNTLQLWSVAERLGGALGVGMASPYGCGASAVEGATWGSIKALYR